VQHSQAKLESEARYDVLHVLIRQRPTRTHQWTTCCNERSTTNYWC